MSGELVGRWDVPNSPLVDTHPYFVSVPVPEDFDGVARPEHVEIVARWSAALDRVGQLMDRVAELTGEEPDDIAAELDDCHGTALCLAEDHGARRAGAVVASVLGLALA